MANRGRPKSGMISGECDIATVPRVVIKEGSKEWLVKEIDRRHCFQYDTETQLFWWRCCVCGRVVRTGRSLKWLRTKHLSRHTKKELMSKWMSQQMM